MFGLKLFQGRGAPLGSTPTETTAPEARPDPKPATTPDLPPSQTTERAREADAPTGTAARGAWLGGFFGRLGQRVRKAAGAALLGATLLGTVGTGAAMAADATPRAEAPVVAAAEAQPDYRVRSGDSLWRISQRKGLDFHALVAANPQFPDPGMIHPGDPVFFPKAAAPAPATPIVTAPTPGRAAVATPDVHLGPKATEAPAEIPAATVPAPETPVVTAPVVTAPVVTAPVIGPPAVTSPVVTTPSATTPAVTLPVTSPARSNPAGNVAVRPADTTPGKPVGEDTPGILNRLTREARKLAFELLVDQDIDFEQSLPFGEFFRANVEIDQLFIEGSGGDWERMAFERSLKDEGKEAVWLSSAGRVRLDGERTFAPWDLEGNARVGFSMIRPYVFDKGGPDAFSAARRLVQNGVQLPFSAEAAARLERGSSLTVRAAAEVDAEGKLSFADVSAGAEADLELRVRRLAEDGVEVRFTRNASLDAKLSADELREGFDLDLDFEAGRQRMQTFRIDLDAPEGRDAYDALMTLDASTAADIAEASDAVRITSEDDGGSRALEAAGRYRPDATLDAKFDAGISRTRDGEEVTRTIEGGADVTVRPEDSTGPTRFQLSGERVSDDDGTTTEIEAGVSGTRELSEDTDLRFSVTAERDHQVMDDRERERRSGLLGHEGTLTTKLLTDGDHPLTLGFDADVEVRYSFETPLGYEGSLPLTGEMMRQAPEGSRFSVRGEGRLGFDAERSFEDLDLAATMAAEGEISFEARRLAGDQVQVNVRLERTVEHEGEAGYAHTTDEGGRYTFSLSRETDRDAEQRASFTLSLDKPSHREAYAALLKGNMGPASRLLNVEAPTWVKRVDRAYNLSLGAAPFEWFDAGLELTRRDVDPTDARVRWNSDRNALTESLQEDGREVRWIEGQGALAPKLRFSNTVPVGAGVVNWRHGFSADKLVQYRAFAPQIDGVSPTLWPAMDAESALAMPRGAEFELLGRGKLSGFTGVGAGFEWGGTGFEASAALAFDTTHTVERNWEVEVRRTDGSGVQVSFEEGRGRKHAFELAARAGVQVDSVEVLGLETAVEQIGLLETVTDAIDEEAERRLGFEFEHNWSKSSSRSERLTFALDLDHPRAARAYADLVTLDMDQALALSTQPDSGVTIERGRTTETEESRRHTHLDLFGERFFLMDALRKDSTTIERWDGGHKRTDRSTYEESYEGLLGRDQEVRWEAVRVRTNEDPTGQGYYRLRLTDEDPRTGTEEVRRLVRLGQALEAEAARPLRIEEGARGLNKLFGRFARHGETELKMDLFFTGEGVEALRHTGRLDAVQAYGEVAARLRGDAVYGWAKPEFAERAERILTEYFELKDDHHLDDKEKREAERSLEVQYWRLTGNELWEDDDPYLGAQAFGRMVERMAASTDPVEWNRAFADLGEDLGFDVYDAIGAMQALSGSDQLLVHRLEMKGRAVDIEMKDEGLLRRPS